MLKRTFKFSLLLFSLGIIWSCGPSKSESSNSENVTINYKAEIADSVVFKRLSQVQIEAINDATNELLLFDEQKREMLVIDGEGNLLSSFDPFVEGPNYMGDRSFGWTFYGKDQIIGFGYTHFYLFTKEGKRIQRVAYPIDVGGWVTMDYDPRRVIGYEKGGKKAGVALLPGQRGVSSRTQAYQDSAHIVFNVSFENNEVKPIFGKPEQSVYRTGGKYLGSGYPTMDHLGEGKFVVGYEADENIYIMNALTNTLEQTITLPEAYWPIAMPVNFGPKVSADLRKVVANVYSLKDQFAVKIFGRIPDFELDILRKIPRWYESPELKQLEKKYISQDILLFSEEGFLGSVDWNLGQIDYRYFGDKNGFIWVKRNYDDERDYHTFLKVRIVPEEE